MRAIRRLHVDQDLVLAIALGDEVERRLVRPSPVGVVHQDDTVVGEERLGDLQAPQLMLVVVVAVVEVEADRRLVLRREVLLVVHVEEAVHRCPMLLEPGHERLLGSEELGEVVDAYAELVRVAADAAEEAEPVPDAHVHVGLRGAQALDPAVHHRAHREGPHPRDLEQRPQHPVELGTILGQPGIERVEGRARKLEQGHGRSTLPSHGETPVPAALRSGTNELEIDLLDELRVAAAYFWYIPSS